MAAESAALYSIAPRRQLAFTLGDTGFLAFLALIFVGLEPFAVRDASALVGAAGTTSGTGDVARQFAFASVFALIVFAALREGGLRALSAVSPMLALLLGWCLLSAFWSPEPFVTLRRAALASVIVSSAMLSVCTLGPARSFQLLRWILASVLIVNWCSILLVPQAVHLAGDPEPLLVGDWRGLYFHKNIAGAVSAITAILFFFVAWEKRRLTDAVLCAAAAGFTVMTRSKASLVLLPVALAMGGVYRAAWSHKLDRMIVIAAFGLATVIAFAFVLIDQNAIARIIENPDEFTGRAEIWQAELAYIKDHPFFGAGFGAFADTGAVSPLAGYVTGNWVGTVAHGHNAYLQLLVTIGGIGFVFAVAALVVAPLMTFLRARPAEVTELALPFAVFAFVVLHNFLESDFLEGDSPAWVSFLVVLAVLQSARRGLSREEWKWEP